MDDSKPTHTPSCCNGVDGPCTNDAEWRRQRTSYVDDTRNWVFMCDDCAASNDEYWKEMWNGYYSGCL